MKQQFCFKDVIGTYRGNEICMHCPTHEDMESFCTYVYRELLPAYPTYGIKPPCSSSYWGVYAEDTVVFFLKGTFGSIGFATKSLNSKVLEYSDYYFNPEDADELWGDAGYETDILF